MTIILHRSSYWHYLFDFNVMMTQMLRDFSGVKKICFVRNHARVKPHFHTWFNRFVGAMMRLDRVERFGRRDCKAEKTWWEWSFDGTKQAATLVKVPSKDAGLDVEAYDEHMAPMMEWLKRSMEVEEYDPDPMSRLGFV
ncbi:hypothetical protein E4T38_07203 [Aureobasidium subglaciale]|nr:hypothetical protein E4T38_07203 [Aureobasidium subglaciale]KAI5217799.1 hypothetical protein E4T40_07214 [Aureobasidium subglaciale]KAI5220659.1 hypothetical protein E4T41_07368 [Aureobasidium subglaciale]KAI5258376.1 hypothetical protein E4T46_07345 [Aureobasidium subglaciale]